LTLEALDLRLPPSSLDPAATDSTLAPPGTATPVLIAASTAPATTTTTTTNPTPTTPTGSPAVPPQLVNFLAVPVVGGLWSFSGDVIDAAPAGLTVALGGEPPSLQGVKTTTDANGHFSVSVLMHTDGSDNGYAAAQTADGTGTASNVALYYVKPG
jgi:hypothetical protein